MALVIHCPTCRNPLTVHEAQAGTAVACPTCHHPLTVPVPAAAAEPEPAFVPRRKVAKKPQFAVHLAVIAVGFVATAGAGVWVAVRPASNPAEPVAAAPVAQAKPEPVAQVKPVPVPPVPPVPRRVDAPPKPAEPKKVEPKKVEPVAPNAEWERKSRAKLAEGLELLRDPTKRDDATIAMSYAFADAPPAADMTNDQLELMLEVSERLTAIALADKDKKKAELCLTLIDRYRKCRKWDADTHDTWARPIFSDTCERIGLKK